MNESQEQAYLIIADETEEFQVALGYAARLATSRSARLYILKVVDMESVQTWGNIEHQMKLELRRKAEAKIWSVAKKTGELCPITPVLYIREGNPADVLVDMMNEDPAIKLLILGGNAEGTNPGSLVSYFSGKGLSRLKIPLAIIPGNLSPGMISPLI